MLASIPACPDGRGQTPAPTATLRDALIQLARGEGDLAPLTVTFDHLHALHGGLQLAIYGDGSIQQQAVRTTVGDPKDKVTPDDLKALVARLVKHEVWTQRVDERAPLPDESRATLKICYREACVEIWEWYNDLDKNARIGEVLKLMQTVAWKPAAPERWTVTIRTSGGFFGRGTGGIVVTSDEVVGTGPVSRQLLEALRRAVAEAKPATWASSYVRPTCVRPIRTAAAISFDTP